VKGLKIAGASDNTPEARFCSQCAAPLDSLAAPALGLEFLENLKRYPIAQEKIERPLFATGEARTGTTLLQALLSVDPNGRALRVWEVMYPSPPPGLSGSDDPGPARADDDWRDLLKRLPF
jgi:hypothetical protein